MPHRLFLKFWLLPPTINILMVVLGVLIIKRHFKTGLLLCLSGVVSLWLFSTPYFANQILLGLETNKVIKPAELLSTLALSEHRARTAIVILGSGHYSFAPEFGLPQPDNSAVERLSYGAFLHRQTALPILLSGGSSNIDGEVHAEILADFMQSQLAISPRWIEGRSLTTMQNARFSAEILLPINIDRVVLVSQSSHMRRAKQLFERVGFEVVAAPTKVANAYMSTSVINFLPTAIALKRSRAVIHEYFGLLWYAVSPIAD